MFFAYSDVTQLERLASGSSIYTRNDRGHFNRSSAEMNNRWQPAAATTAAVRKQIELPALVEQTEYDWGDTTRRVSQLNAEISYSDEPNGFRSAHALTSSFERRTEGNRCDKVQRTINTKNDIQPLTFRVTYLM